MPARIRFAIAALALLAIAFLAPGGRASAESTTAAAGPPETKIVFGPEGWTFARRPTFGYESDDPNAEFECRLDARPFDFCGPATYESLEGHRGAQLSEAAHSFEVRAIGADGEADPTPARADFTVDAQPPTATIVSGPPAVTHQRRPKFGLRVAGEDSFRCQIIGNGVRVRVRSCDGPETFRPPRPLREGSYEMALVASDLAGNETEDRVEFSVRTKAGPPPPPPDPYRGSILYTGRGKGVKRVSFRLRGDKLIEASIVFVESCTVRGGGHGRRFRSLLELEEASPRVPLRVNGRGRFRAFRSDVYFAGDEFEEFAGEVTPRSISGGITRESNESAPESGIFNGCKTGPFGGPRQELSFHAIRRPATGKAHQPLRLTAPRTSG